MILVGIDPPKAMATMFSPNNMLLTYHNTTVGLLQILDEIRANHQKKHEIHVYIESTIGLPSDRAPVRGAGVGPSRATHLNPSV